MEQDKTDLLAELLCAKLCHDLAGAVGAVAAGAELLSEESAMSPIAGEAVDLMATSAASMAAKLRFLRAALGPANGAAGESRELSEAYIAKGFPQGDWKLDWPADQGYPAGGDHNKLLLNLICLAQDCLPRGGIIAVRPLGKVVVTALGGGVARGASLEGLDAPAASGLSPRAAQGYYAAILAQRLGLQIEARLQEGSYSFSLIPLTPV